MRTQISMLREQLARHVARARQRRPPGRAPALADRQPRAPGPMARGRSRHVRQSGVARRAALPRIRVDRSDRRARCAARGEPAASGGRVELAERAQPLADRRHRRLDTHHVAVRPAEQAAVPRPHVCAPAPRPVARRARGRRRTRGAADTSTGAAHRFTSAQVALDRTVDVVGQPGHRVPLVGAAGSIASRPRRRTRSPSTPRCVSRAECGRQPQHVAVLEQPRPIRSNSSRCSAYAWLGAGSNGVDSSTPTGTG